MKTPRKHNNAGLYNPTKILNGTSKQSVINETMHTVLKILSSKEKFSG